MPEPIDYKTYRQWKGWDQGQLNLPAWLQRYFRLELARAGVSEARTILEIGFGNGEFLQWLKMRGCDGVGVELIPELVEAACERGFDAYLYDMAAQEAGLSPFEDRIFDAVVAFDVAEHLSVAQIQRLFCRLQALLRPGGKVVLRFPNGESPLFTPIHNGDHTHRTALCRLKLAHLCLGTGLQLERYDNAARVAGKASTAWLKWLIFRLRDLVEILVGGLYYSHRRPLDPVATAVLKRSSD